MEATRVSERTTVGVFLRQADRLGDRVLVRHHDGSDWQELSWSGMRALVLTVAAQLVRTGVGPGDRVVLMSENRVEWLYCDLAIQLVGAVTVPIYPTTAADTAQQIVDNAEARLAIVSGPELAGRLRLDRVVTMAADLPAWVAAEADPQLAAEVDRRATAISPDDLVTLVYTSGTTGRPKGVMLAHRNLVDVSRAALQVFDLGEDDQTLSFLPYSHVLERINSVFVGIMAGGSAWLSRGVDRMAEDLQAARPTVMVSVPRVYEKMHQAVMAEVRRSPRHRRLLFRWALGAGRRRSRGRRSLTHPLADRLVLAPIRGRLAGGRLRYFVSGGAPLAREVEEFFWSIGIRVLQGWGMTETSSGATSNTETAHRFESVGRPMPGVEVKIAGDGEILLRGPGNMLGYHRDPEATAETLIDGWVHTGDVGEIDAEGFLRITDRKKDLLKTAGGKYVAPLPLEARLQEDPVIERAMVIGDERPYVTALVVPDWQALEQRLGVSGDPEQLVADDRVRGAVQRALDSLNQRLSSWESVKYFTLLARDFSEADGELTPTLKVKRRAVRERHREAIDAMYRDRERPGGDRR